MLGSLSEADDAVQEAWVRLSRSDADEIENLGGWLTTVVGRVSLNMLRSRKSRREQPLGVHVPDPIVDPADGTDPEHEALVADSVGLALLVVLETLSPAERLAFVLHDIFAVPFDEIAPIVDRSPEAARQLASRARRRVRAENTVPDADLDAQREVVDAFLAAAREGTSTDWWRFSTPMSSLDRTLAQPDREKSEGRRRSPARLWPTRISGSSSSRRSSTARWDWSRRGTVSPSRSEGSRYATEESSRWTGSPTPRACASST